MNTYEQSAMYLGSLVEEAKETAVKRVKKATKKPVAKKDVNLFLESIELIDDEKTSRKRKGRKLIKESRRHRSRRLKEESVDLGKFSEAINSILNGDISSAVGNFIASGVTLKDLKNEIEIAKKTNSFISPDVLQELYDVVKSNKGLTTVKEEGKKFDFEDAMQQVAKLMKAGEKDEAKKLLDEIIADTVEDEGIAEEEVEVKFNDGDDVVEIEIEDDKIVEVESETEEEEDEEYEESKRYRRRRIAEEARRNKVSRRKKLVKESKRPRKSKLDLILESIEIIDPREERRKKLLRKAKRALRK